MVESHRIQLIQMMENAGRQLADPARERFFEGKPPGLDPDRGVCWEPYVRADATLTLALPKQGLREPEGQKAAGALYLADTGVPPALYQTLGLKVGTIFARKERIRLEEENIS